MKLHRLWVLLVVPLLGTACVSSSSTCDVRTVDVGWSTFELSDGTITPDCPSDVNYVDVWVDGNVYVGRAPCTDGGMLVDNVLAGTHDWTVEGVDAASYSDSNPRIVVRDFTTTSGDGCNTLHRDTRPSEGEFSLGFSSTGGCVAGRYIWFAIRDDTLGRVTTAVDENSANPGQYLCDSDISFRLPYGPFTLTRVEEVTYDGAYHATGKDCSAHPFDIAGGMITPVTATLASTSSFCP